MLFLVVMWRRRHIVAIHVTEVGVGVLNPHYFVMLENNGCRLAENALVDDAVKTVVEDTYLIALAEGVFAQQASRGTLQALLTDGLTTEQR